MARQTGSLSASSPAYNASSPSPAPLKRPAHYSGVCGASLYHDSQDTGREHMRPP